MCDQLLISDRLTDKFQSLACGNYACQSCCDGVEIWLYPHSIPGLEGGGRSSPRPGRCTGREGTRYRFYRKLGLSLWVQENTPPPDFELLPYSPEGVAIPAAAENMKKVTLHIHQFFFIYFADRASQYIYFLISTNLMH